ncbi:hypothetical protein HON52_00690 [Candidatus Uhrbacteria bacterium]|jgi:thioredoxin 1|nr:hypothetical protein [Candidatus Uhrbacteria bacterium]
MKNYLPTILIVAVIVIAGIYMFSATSYTSDDNQAVVTELDEHEVENDMDEDDGEAIEVEEDSLENGDGAEDEFIAPVGGLYADYDPEFLSVAVDGDVVLFFHATWCPSCRTLESDINTNIQSIPDDVVILQVDYDTETELRQKYGVTVQHTIVQVDENGDLISKWAGGSTLSGVLETIK